jgi:hypothetical protein
MNSKWYVSWLDVLEQREWLFLMKPFFQQFQVRVSTSPRWCGRIFGIYMYLRLNNKWFETFITISIFLCRISA